MMLRRWLPLLASAGIVLTAAQCDGGPFFEQDVPLDTAYFSKTVGGVVTNELNKKLTVGIGSGAWHTQGDEHGIIYTITDRGANIDTADALLPQFLGFQPVTTAGKIFPVPNFAPSIYKLQVSLGQFNVLEVIQLKDAKGVPIPGVSVPAIEQGYDASGAPLAGHKDAIDSEGLVRLANGDFWIASEYGPDLVHVGPDGRIKERMVPAKIAPATEPRLPGTESLPDYYNFRRLNRGFEGIAISPDEKYIYTMMQSPLEKRITGKNAGRQSRCLRFLKIDRATLTLVNEYVYVEQPVTEFTLDFVAGTSSQGNVKCSEMVCLDTDKILVLERETKHTKLFLVKLGGATDTLLLPAVQRQPEAIEVATDPVFNANPATPVTPAGITPVSKTLVFDSAVDFPGLVQKIEGIAWLGGGHFLLINDNDFSTENIQPGQPAVTTLTKIFIAPHKLQ